MSGNVPQRFRDGALAAQFRVLHALVIREMLTRFGQSRVGYVWLVGEPVMLALGVSSLHWMQGGGKQADVPVFLFYGLSYAPFFMFRSIVTRNAGAVGASRVLLYHRSITLHDLVLSRTIVEGVAVIPVILLFVLGGILVANIWPADPGLFALGLLLSAMLSHGAGSLLAALVIFYEPIERVIHPLSYLMLPFSAAFATVDSMPAAFQEILLKNPLVHVNELLRDAQWGNKLIHHYDITFLLLWIVILNFLGLAALRAARSRITMAA